MARIDSSTIKTPANLFALAATLLVFRVGFIAASAHVPTNVSQSAWKAAADSDKDLLPGTQDLVEPTEPKHAVKQSSKDAPVQVFANLPLSETDKQQLASGRSVLYEFVADWSDPCQDMERKALSNKNIVRIIESKFVPIRITDRVREDGKNKHWVANLQKRYHVFALPTLIVVDKQGEQKAALIGNCSSLTVERFLSRI